MNRSEQIQYLVKQGFITDPVKFDSLSQEQIDELCNNAQQLHEVFSKEAGEKLLEQSLEHADEIVKSKYHDLIVEARTKNQELMALKNAVKATLHPLQKLVS